MIEASSIGYGPGNQDIVATECHGTERRIRDSEARYREIFNNVQIAVWEEDFSEVAALLEDFRAGGVTDLRAYLQAHPDRLLEVVHRVHIRDVNAFAVELFEAERKEALLNSLADVFLPETAPAFIEALVTLWEGRRRLESAAVVRTLKARRLDVMFTISFEGARFERTLVSIRDISAHKTAEQALLKQTHRLEALNSIAKSIASDLNLDHIVQTVTDAATNLVGAKFGAFFYNVVDDKGERYTLYTLSGAPRAAFDKFGLPRNTAIFDPTFRGVGIIRSDDIRSDPRYGKSSPHFGMPKGHLPVVSYLAVPVVSRSGEVHGGLFFGHDQAGVFTPESEEIVESIASHAAIAIDNAALLKAAQVEIEHRRRAEERQGLLLREMSHRVNNLFALSSNMVTLSARSATSPEELASAVQVRLGALARAHQLTLPKTQEGTAPTEQSTTLRKLLQTIFSPYGGRGHDKRERVVFSGCDIPVASGAVTSFALLLHEFATNAAKYGALSIPTGYIEIECAESDGAVFLTWKECGGPLVERSDVEGFGSLLSRATVKGQLGGEISHDWKPEGLTIRLSVARDRLAG